MKKFTFFLVLAAMMVACKSNDPDSSNKKNAAFDSATEFTAYGLISVPGQQFLKDSVRVVAELKGDTALDLYLYEVTFSSRMPVTIDMVIPDIPCERTTQLITFAGEDIEPTMGGNPVPKYITTGLAGIVTPDSLCFATAFGGIECIYQGLCVMPW